MDQSDLDLLQIVPSYHLQAVVKSRHISLSALNLHEGSLLGVGVFSYPPAVLQELARPLFDPDALHEVLTRLEALPALILRELVWCGGRANSRDLALYFSCAGSLVSVPSSGSSKDFDSRPFPTGEILAVAADLASASPSNPADLASASPPEVAQTSAFPAGTMAHPTASLNTPRVSFKMPPQPLQPPHYPPPHPHGVFELALRHLLMLGLVFWGKQTNFAGRDYSSGVHDGLLIVSTSVRSIARKVWKLDDPVLPTIPQNETSVGSTADVLNSPQSLQRALYLYWSLVAAQREGLSLLVNGLLSRSSLKLVVDAMQGYGKRFQGNLDQVKVETDVPYLYFLRLVLHQLGLLQAHDTTLKAVSASAFFALPLLERICRCYKLYIDTPFWNELAFLPEINVRPGPGPLEPAHAEVMQARKAILESVLLESVQTWRDMTAFIARIKLSVPYLLFPRHYGPRAERYSSGSNPYGWDFRLRRGWLTHREGWHMVEGGFIRAMVTGPLYWLGLVELDREEMPTQFRLLPAAFLMREEYPGGFSSLEELRGRLIVQPNFEVVVLAPVAEALLVMLDRFAERVSLDLVAHYRISRASITRAIQRGLHAEDVVRELEAATGSELPQNVRYSLAEWERQARRVEIWQNMTLLEVDNESLLDELLADERSRTFFGRRLAPRLIEVVTNHLASVQALFWQRQNLPALTVVSPASAEPEGDELQQELPEREPQWQLHVNGLLQPLYPVLDLYQVVQAQRFCEIDQATSWYKITATSVRQAIEQGFELDTLINFLQASCMEGIPASLLIRLKLWGNGYSSPDGLHIEPAPLLRLPADIFLDLQSDEELQPFFGAEVEQSYRLIRVDPTHLERLLGLLRERGFQVD